MTIFTLLSSAQHFSGGSHRSVWYLLYFSNHLVYRLRNNGIRYPFIHNQLNVRPIAAQKLWTLKNLCVIDNNGIKHLIIFKDLIERINSPGTLLAESTVRFWEYVCMILNRLVGTVFIESKTPIHFFGHNVLCLKYCDAVRIIVISKSICVFRTCVSLDD
jgi:hypothetical protein